MQLIGCDFSSSPTRKKSIVIAISNAFEESISNNSLKNMRVSLSKCERIASLNGFSDWLKMPKQWVGGFDFPFGLPRELIEYFNWPTRWEDCIRHYASLNRSDIRIAFKAFCDARPVGQKFAHRETDAPANSSPSMKWVNPPVAFMLHAGVPRLLDACVHIPGLGDAGLAEASMLKENAKLAATENHERVALEAYPGLLAREIIGNRSYKSDDKVKQTPERLIERKNILTALESGQTRLQLHLKLSHAQRDMLVDDASGDSLDAVLCMVQAAWAYAQHKQGKPRYGLPICDPLEGWIVTA